MVTLLDKINAAVNNAANHVKTSADLVAAAAAHVSAQEADAAAAVAETQALDDLAAVLPENQAFIVNPGRTLVKIGGKPVFLDAVDPSSVVLEPDPPVGPTS